MTEMQMFSRWAELSRMLEKNGQDGFRPLLSHPDMKEMIRLELNLRELGFPF